MNGVQKTRMPVLFVGHGSPMNGIQQNSFTKTLNDIGSKFPRPKANLVISAHWMTEGTWVTGMEQPKTIHDFYGFPQELFEVQYPAPGSSTLAESLQTKIENFKINRNMETWGLDHGTWAILRHIYPKADIPTLQLSLHMEQPPEYHYRLGKELSKLRDEGVLIIGSGNVVHNLRTMNWETYSQPYEWATEYDNWIKEKLLARDFSALTDDFQKTEAGRMSVPTPEHYYPFLYVIGAADERDHLDFHFEEIHNASISMRTLSFS